MATTQRVVIRLKKETQSSVDTTEVAAMSYSDTVKAINSECAKINLKFSTEGDGRLTSALKEREYLDQLVAGLKNNYPSINVKVAKERFWYDIRINTIPINLKLTTGGTDNAFNKVACIYTISGEEGTLRSMNYNQLYSSLKAGSKKSERDYMTEYHYLVIDKESGSVLFKSILDIHTYKTNPCNILQINWKNEFKNIEHMTPVDKYKKKIQELLKTIQASLRQFNESMKEFLEADIEIDFPI